MSAIAQQFHPMLLAVDTKAVVENAYSCGRGKKIQLVNSSRLGGHLPSSKRPEETQDDMVR